MDKNRRNPTLLIAPLLIVLLSYGLLWYNETKLERSFSSFKVEPVSRMAFEKQSYVVYHAHNEQSHDPKITAQFELKTNTSRDTLFVWAKPLPRKYLSASETITINGIAYKSVAKIEIPKKGNYALVVKNAPETQTTFAIQKETEGKSCLESMLGYSLLLLLGGALFLFALIRYVFLLIRNKNS